MDPRVIKIAVLNKCIETWSSINSHSFSLHDLLKDYFGVTASQRSPLPQGSAMGRNRRSEKGPFRSVSVYRFSPHSERPPAKQLA